jgi:hypothetical protein
MTKSRFRLNISAEEIEAMKQDRLAERKKLTAEYQFGYYAGEYIYMNFLPTLSVDGLQSRNVIKVSDEEEAEAKRLQDIWFPPEGFEASKDKTTWNNLRAYHEMLEAKYLPAELKCHMPCLNVVNEAEFKEGLISSLWDTDLCHYSLKPENIRIEHDEDGYCSYVVLIRE